MQQVTLVSPECLRCIKNNLAVSICTNEKCLEQAFICNDDQCQCYKSKHQKCAYVKSKYIINSIENQKIGITTPQSQRSFDQVIKIYDDMIQKISKDRTNFVDFMDMFGLGDSMRKFVNLLNIGSENDIKGELVYQITQEISEQKKKFCLDYNKAVSFWEKKQMQFDSILEQLARYTDQKYLQSKIIDHQGFQKLKKYMHKQVKDFDLLFRASQNDFLASKFHEKCDGEGDTVVLVETEFGKIIGGYSPVKWESKTGRYQQDPSGKSFLFSLSLDEKYELMQDQNKKAVYHYIKYGPDFGDGADLVLMDKCNKPKSGSYANFPCSYNNGKYVKGQQSYTAFTGQTKANYFKVREYEVFKVQWKQQQQKQQ